MITTGEVFTDLTLEQQTEILEKKYGKTSNQTTCECGEVLNYRTTPFKSIEVRVCPKCGRHHNVDTDLIDWDKLKARKDD